MSVARTPDRADLNDLASVFIEQIIETAARILAFGEMLEGKLRFPRFKVSFYLRHLSRRRHGDNDDACEYKKHSHNLFIIQSRDAGKHVASKKFKGRSAAGRDVRDLIVESGVVHSRD